MKNLTIKEEQKRFRKRLVILGLIILVIFIISIIPGWRCIYEISGIYPLTGDLNVHFIDVGQGDAAFIADKSKNMLIDAGPDKNAERLSCFLDRYHIDEIDTVIISHPDSDHTSGLKRLLSEYKVTRVLIPKVKRKYIDDFIYYDEIIKILKKNNIPLQYIKAGSKVNTGFDVEILSPNRDFKNSNDNSAVVKLRYGKRSFLFTGDISKKAENALLESKTDVSADVIKISHHGSRYSSSKEFLKRVNPDVAVLSVGENTSNLPNIEAVKRIESAVSELLRTDLDGNISISCDGEQIYIRTEK